MIFIFNIFKIFNTLLFVNHSEIHVENVIVFIHYSWIFHFLFLLSYARFSDCVLMWGFDSLQVYLLCRVSDVCQFLLQLFCSFLSLSTFHILFTFILFLNFTIVIKFRILLALTCPSILIRFIKTFLIFVNRHNWC